MPTTTRAIIAGGPHDLKLGEVAVAEPGAN